ncbi:MAG: NosD domain-containing protein [Candidatus Hodarchaeales archaeon]
MILGTIHINNNWSVTKNAGVCTGEGTRSNPYVIKDLVIDGEGLRSCIFIQNSDVYFKIENCIIYNSGTNDYVEAGIKLCYVTNGLLINNSCSFNKYGIFLENSKNINISGNRARNNSIYDIEVISCDNINIIENIVSVFGVGISISQSNYVNFSRNIINIDLLWGVRLSSSKFNTISENRIINNRNIRGIGIELYNSEYNNISGNIMVDCGLDIKVRYIYRDLYSRSSSEFISNNIDTTNLVNNKFLYFYTNQVNLKSKNFSNAGQIIMINCNDSFISNLDVSHGGISLFFCKKIHISNNDVSHCLEGIRLFKSENCIISKNNAGSYWTGIDLMGSDYNTIIRNIFDCINEGSGIHLDESDHNIISENIVYSDGWGITLYFSDDNTISGNILIVNNIKRGYFSHESEYNIILVNIIIANNIFSFLLGILSLIAIILLMKLINSVQKLYRSLIIR